jgi:hypothetical protein
MLHRPSDDHNCLFGHASTRRPDASAAAASSAQRRDHLGTTTRAGRIMVYNNVNDRFVRLIDPGVLRPQPDSYLAVLHQ